MKRFLTLIFAAICTLTLTSSCNMQGDNIPELAGKSFTYSNGEVGMLRIYQVYDFDGKGGVYHYSAIGIASSFDTKDCDLYYTLNGDELVIYKGVKGWKKEARHTVYASGHYYGDYIEIDGKKFYKD